MSFRPLAASLALFLSVAAASADPFFAEVPVETREMRFAPPEASRLEFRGAFAIRPPDGRFGGLSGLLMERPRTALALSDRAIWFRIGLVIAEGRLTGVTGVSSAPMRDAGGAVVEGGGWDSEGLARARDGSIWASFESDHRIQRFAAPGAPAGEELRRKDWEAFGVNSGLEALATDAAGRLWAIPERSGDLARPFPVHVGGSGGWEVKRLPRRPPYLPTGADFGPGGWLYVTERAFSYFEGFRFRLRRFRWGAGPEPLDEEELIRLSSDSRIDNIEGVAVWEEAGETLILLIADDNFSIFQRNVLALFALK